MLLEINESNFMSLYALSAFIFNPSKNMWPTLKKMLYDASFIMECITNSIQAGF